MTLRLRKCGDCEHFRPFEDQLAGLCGGVLPEVKDFGTVPEIDPDNPGRVRSTPLLITVRPEVRAIDPSCLMFELYDPMSLKDRYAEQNPPRSAVCKVPGCKCKRLEEGDYCADHEDYEGAPAAEAESEVHES